MAVKGYMKDVNEAVNKFKVKVGTGDAKKKYEENLRYGLREGWSVWYNNMMWYLTQHAADWADKEGLDKMFAVKDLVKIASKEYRMAKLGMFINKYKPELDRAHAIVEEALATLGM